MKKELKKRLKADEFRVLVNKSIDYIRSHQKQFAAGAGAFILIFLVFLGIRYIQAQATQKESRILGRIIQLNQELVDHPEKLAELEALGGKGKFSRLAYIYTAAFLIETQKLEEAAAALDKIPESPKDITYYQAQEMRAKILSLQDKPDEALAVYQAIEADRPADYPLDAVMFHMAGIYIEKGDIELAISTYKRIQEDYPQTYYGYEASQEVTKLETKK